MSEGIPYTLSMIRHSEQRKLSLEVYCAVLPLFCDAPEKGIHSLGAVALHTTGDMSIYIQCKGCCVMPQVLLYGFDVVACLQAVHGKGVPLRYNYDKPEESRNIKGFQGFKPDF